MLGSLVGESKERYRSTCSISKTGRQMATTLCEYMGRHIVKRRHINTSLQEAIEGTARAPRATKAAFENPDERKLNCVFYIRIENIFNKITGTMFFYSTTCNSQIVVKYKDMTE